LFEMASRSGDTSRRPSSSRGRKKLAPQVVLGQKGINLIERVVLEMGCIWNPTGAIDVGIDGTIELCDRTTGEPLGLFLHVQSKATDGTWDGETAEGLYYTCRSQDLDYWMQGNAPVLLIASRPAKGDAYWLSVKDYFGDPTRRQSRRAHFDKQKDRFAPEAYPALLALATPRDVGLYLAPAPKTEQQVSNLLEVRSFGTRIYVADTRMRRRSEIWDAFRKLGAPCRSEWLLKDKRIVSFRDLGEFPWDRVCDRGTVEDFDAHEWAYSPDQDRRRDFVRLLNGALQERLVPEVRPWRKLGIYAFTAPKDLRPRTIRYVSHARPARRTVFEVYSRVWKGQAYTHYRHIRTFPSSQAAATTSPFGDNARLCTNPLPPISVRTRDPSVTHHTRTSSPGTSKFQADETRIPPSAEKITDGNPSALFRSNSRSGAPSATRHRRMGSLRAPDASVRPSGANATLFTG
jgi:hypothetical protein